MMEEYLTDGQIDHYLQKIIEIPFNRGNDDYDSR